MATVLDTQTEQTASTAVTTRYPDDLPEDLRYDSKTVNVFNKVVNDINSFTSTIKAQSKMIDKMYVKMIETVETKCVE